MRDGGIASVLVAGPTASGKSALALEIAELAGGEIVNTDSMQVYRDLSIVTARPDDEDLGRAAHHLYGHVDGAENHSVGRWREHALRALADIVGRGRLPIFVGGTGLYFKALEIGLAAMPQVPADVREAVRAAAEALPTPDLHERLARKRCRNGLEAPAERPPAHPAGARGDRGDGNAAFDLAGGAASARAGRSRAEPAAFPRTGEGRTLCQDRRAVPRHDRRRSAR